MGNATSDLKPGAESLQGRDNPNFVLVKATCDYKNYNSDRLSFKKDDVMKIIEDRGDYYFASEMKTSSSTGLIPKNFVKVLNASEKAKIFKVGSDSSVDDAKPYAEFEWFSNVKNKNEAEEVLFAPPNKVNSFLVRKCNSPQANYAITVRQESKFSNYLVYEDKKNRFYLVEKQKFCSLPDLIKYYSQPTKEVEIVLETPCVQDYLFFQGSRKKKSSVVSTRSQSQEKKGKPVKKTSSSNMKSKSQSREENFEKDKTGSLDHKFSLMMHQFKKKKEMKIDDQWEIDRSSIRTFQEIGTGNFGSVHFGVLNEDTEVAVKKLKEDLFEKRSYEIETKTLKSLRHQNILQFYGTCTKEKPFLIITEFMMNGDLLKYFQTDSGKNLSFPSLIDIAKQVASGMAYLESKKYVHRDLAARNVLVGRGNVYKIADFGMARLVENKVYKPGNDYQLPVKWSAPESIEFEKFTHKSDVWSFGVCLTEIFEKGKPPYQGIEMNKVVEMVQRGHTMKRTSLPSCPEEIYKIMLRCWKNEPKERPTFKEALQMLVDYEKNNSQVVPSTGQTQANRHYVTMSKIWKIDYRSLQIKETIGSGQFGKVHRGVLHERTPVAVKVLNPCEMSEKKEEKGFLNEVEPLKKLKHPNIVKLYGFSQNANGLLIVTEYMMNGDLRKYLSEGPGKSLDFNELFAIAFQVLSGMNYLESQNYIHRHLAARNVLIGKDSNCKVADFALARIVEDGIYTSSSKNETPIRWCAPESLREAQYSNKSDVWSFGICLTEIIEKGKQPYADSIDDDVTRLVITGGVMKQDSLPNCPDELYKIMMDCWKFEKTERPSFGDLHDIFSQYWNARGKNSQETEDPFEIQRSDLKHEKVQQNVWKSTISQGVYKGDKVAIKTRKQAVENCQEVLEEIDLLKKLTHKNIIRLIGACTVEDPALIITEFMEKGNLHEFLCREENLSKHTCLNISLDIASGMDYLESNNVILCCLTAKSVWIGKNNKCKIADFSSAQVNENGLHCPSLDANLNVNWSSPEVLRNFEFSHKSDVWAYGIVLFEIIEKGSTPYLGKTKEDVADLVLRGDCMDLSHMLYCTEEMYEVMKQCWAYDKWERPTFKEVEQTISCLFNSEKKATMKEEKENSSYQLNELLGSGTFGQVFKEVLSNQTVAIRAIEKDKIIQSHFETCFLDSLKSLQHQNLVQLMDVEREKTRVYFITEYISNGTLLEYLHKTSLFSSTTSGSREEGLEIDSLMFTEICSLCFSEKQIQRNEDISPKKVISIGVEIASGMAYLEQENVVHGNLAARNVLMGENDTWKISDAALFSLFEITSEVDDNHLKWKAPEVNVSEANVSHKSDAWSFGICLYEIAEQGKEPYPGVSGFKVAEKIQKGDRMEIEDMDFCSGRLFRLMKKCWEQEPSNRPSFSEILSNLTKFYSK